MIERVLIFLVIMIFVIVIRTMQLSREVKELQKENELMSDRVRSLIRNAVPLDIFSKLLEILDLEGDFINLPFSCSKIVGIREKTEEEKEISRLKARIDELEADE